MRKWWRRRRWQKVVRQIEQLREEQNAAPRGRQGPPTDEERATLKSLAERGRILADRETKLRKHGI